MAKTITYCTVEGCDRRCWGQGLCLMHYGRMRRHGSVEDRPRKGRPPVPFRACSVEGCEQRAKSKGMCQIHYVRGWHKARYVPVPRKLLEDRFWAKVDRSAPDECWEWLGAKSNGYGAFQMAKSDGRFASHTAHRIAYYLVNGDVPEGFHLHHRCGNRGCVNPAHLEPIVPRTHTVKTWVETLRTMGYTVTEPDAHD